MRYLLTIIVLCCAGCSLIDTGEDVKLPPLIPLDQLRDVRVAMKDWIGQTPQEILTAAGTPDRQALAADREWWTYEDRFRDPVTNKRVPFATFYFVKGKLQDVTF